MPILDIFSNNAFSPVALSEAIDKVDHVPNHLGSLGVFVDNPIREEKVAIESRSGTLSLIQTSPRGAPLDNRETEKRNIRDFRTVRIAKRDRIHASELQFIRQMGEEQAVMELQAEIARRLSGPMGLMSEVEMTWENMRLGALQGIVTDADDSVIYNYYTEFGINEGDEIAFDLGTKKDGALRTFIQNNVVRPMRTLAKGVVYQQPYALCGNNFFDDLMANAEVRETFLSQPESARLREGTDKIVFDFAGVRWTNYIGTDDNSTVAIDTEKVRFFPAGGRGVFETAFAPGESFSDIGTLGQPIYAKIIPDDKREQYVDLEVYSYPLHIARRPDMLLRGKAGS